MEANSSACQKPAIPANMELVDDREEYGINTTIEWSCLNTSLCQVLEGNSTQVCLETGNWSGTAPSCICNLTFTVVTMFMFIQLLVRVYEMEGACLYIKYYLLSYVTGVRLKYGS